MRSRDEVTKPHSYLEGSAIRTAVDCGRRRRAAIDFLGRTRLLAECFECLQAAQTLSAKLRTGLPGTAVASFVSDSMRLLL